MTITFTQSRCHINLAAIVRNFRKLGNAASLMPVVKSDAYGHGLVEVARALAEAGATRFAVGMPEEGAALRRAGINGAIVPLMGCQNREDWQIALENDLMPVVGSREDLELASAISTLASDRKLNIAIKCDTGMSRLGFDLSQASEACERLSGMSAIRPTLLISHLACADMPEEAAFTASQFETFKAFYAIAKERFPFISGSLGNSAGTLRNPAFEIFRPGIALYGYSPFGSSHASGLEPAMSVSAPILHIRDLAPGQSVSYGRQYCAQKPMRIAIVGCGYATGVSRNLSGRMRFLINGRTARQIGRICMSMCMADITHLPDARPGDLAWIMGGGGDNSETPVWAVELAEQLGTIPYELLCLLGGLNPRVYE